MLICARAVFRTAGRLHLLLEMLTSCQRIDMIYSQKAVLLSEFGLRHTFTVVGRMFIRVSDSDCYSRPLDRTLEGHQASHVCVDVFRLLTATCLYDDCQCTALRTKTLSDSQ